MAEINIWNLALARTGDDATVSSPTERSRQAELCRQFYATARDTVLEMHDWNFATRRALLAPVTRDDWVNWAYAYAAPANFVRVFQVGDVDAVQGSAAQEADQFEIETNAAGEPLIYSNVENALVRYTERITNTDAFSPLFTDALAWLLASYLAGPILKGETGRAEGQRLLNVFNAFMEKAAGSDSRQRRVTNFRDQHAAPWITARGGAMTGNVPLARRSAVPELFPAQPTVVSPPDDTPVPFDFADYYNNLPEA